jgi:hypothetical protein
MEDQVIRLAVERNDALSVLRDLVAIEDALPEFYRRIDPAMDRARALVAEHTTNEER